MDAYTIPDLRLPFATAANPQARRVQGMTEEWCRGRGLLSTPRVADTFRALGYGRIMSTLCPDAPLAGLALVTDWNSLFFIADDQQNIAVTTNRAARYEELVSSMRQIIAGRPDPTPQEEHPLVMALRDLLRRTLPGRPSYWKRRFRENLDLWLRGHLAENFYRVSGTVPDVASYVSLRRAASTVLPTLDLVEMVEGATVPDALYRTSRYQTLVLGTADIMCWINDIHSLHMEEGDPINLVTVLDHCEHLGVQRAIESVAARIAARVAEYTVAARDLPMTMDELGLAADSQALVMRCVRDQQSWAAGMETWDRTDTIRFAGSEASASYAEDLLDISQDLLEQTS
jgi:hypothetical protein